MSHFKERKEKNCLNCGATVVGRYCHVCGQENIEPRESIWHLVLHYFYDITHFDGKFFSTTKHLMFRPGFLPKEYMKGRRNSYLNPIRMYVFTSAIFFLLFFTFYFSPGKVMIEENMDKTRKLFENISSKVNVTIRPGGDIYVDDRKIGNIDNPDSAMIRYLDSLRKSEQNGPDRSSDSSNKRGSVFGEAGYSSRLSYDSAQALLPAEKRDGWFIRAMNYRRIEIREKYNGNEFKFLLVLVDKFMHLLPTIMFLSLPLFALVLHLLYIRGKRFYYVNHVIFTIHLYTFTFLMMLFFFLFNRLGQWNSSSVWGWLQFLVWVLIMIYLYKAMRYFYGQGRGKTILKFILVNMFSTIVIIILFAIFASYTAIYG